MFKIFSNKKNNLFETENYKMKAEYNSNDLVVGKLCSVSCYSDTNDYEPLENITDQKYLFEKIIQRDGNVKYREIFTGLIVTEKSKYFELPYIVDIQEFENVMNNYKNDKIPYLSCLLLLDEINYKESNKIKKL